MKVMDSLRRSLPAATMLAVGLCAWHAEAQDDFYKGKTITFVLSTGPGGGYAAYGRLLAPHLVDHLAGKPNIIVQSMPGAGGLRATNFLYAQAPKDGTTIGLIHSTAVLAPVYGTKAAHFDSRKFNWLGSMSSASGICISWHTSPIKTWQDMLDREFIVGSSGVGSQMEVLPMMINQLFGTKMKVISGYKDGISVFLGMERGEVEGRCGGLLTPLKLTHPDWIPDKKVNVPIAIATKRLAIFPDTPSIMEFAKDDQTRMVLQLVFAPQQFDRPILSPPGLPEARVKELRTAFEAAMNSPELKADAEKLHLDIDLVTGEEMLKLIDMAYAVPPEIVEVAKAAMSN
jgi:tripartite-type tricarboxylate transporter receptor subunit TctC